MDFILKWVSWAVRYLDKPWWTAVKGVEFMSALDGSPTTGLSLPCPEVAILTNGGPGNLWVMCSPCPQMCLQALVRQAAALTVTLEFPNIRPLTRSTVDTKQWNYHIVGGSSCLQIGHIHFWSQFLAAAFWLQSRRYNKHWGCLQSMSGPVPSPPPQLLNHA